MPWVKRKKAQAQEEEQQLPEEHDVEESSPLNVGEPILTALPRTVDYIDDNLDPRLIGRTITLVEAHDWEEDLVKTPSQQTRILYENQRG
jgi:hypothetical protein